ncbi:hypothetical protein PACTADRAFT_49676, partial [Pachysolen tannophilus NRRL Y-2460]
MSLFVPEEENNVNHGRHKDHKDVGNVGVVENRYEDDDDDDEVLSEIPIYLNDRLKNLALLQYPNRSSKRPFSKSHNTPILESRIKKESGILELDVPMNTAHFFDSQKAIKWGELNTQTLSGVCKKNSIYYVGVLNKDKDKITLTPIDTTVQMRPQLKHIDAEILEQRALKANANRSNSDYFNDPKRKNDVKVVQMSVKSTMDVNPSLGGALQAYKKAEDEQYDQMNWNDIDENVCKNL